MPRECESVKEELMGGLKKEESASSQGKGGEGAQSGLD